MIGNTFSTVAKPITEVNNTDPSDIGKFQDWQEGEMESSLDYKDIEEVPNNQIENCYDSNFENKIENSSTPEGVDNIRKNYENVNDVLSETEKKLASSPNELELQKIDRNIERYKGTIFEDMCKDALKDDFDSLELKQKIVETKEGGTKPDIVLHGAKEEVQLGDVTVKKGEDLCVETKCGGAEYLKDEIDNGHILKQVLGHEGNSVVIVTKDYENIDPATRVKFERELKDRNSGIYVVNTYADQVSSAILNNLKY